MTHAPTPWRVATDSFSGRLIEIVDATGDRAASCDVANMVDDEDEANAAFIVRACNAHDDLVAALTEVLDDFEGDLRASADGHRGNTDADFKSEFPREYDLCSRARAALAKAIQA